MRLAALVVVASIMLAPAARAEPVFLPEQFRGHVDFLASDRLEGREAGSPGYDLAARYVADRFKAFGLKPGVRGGWFQQVPLPGREDKKVKTSPNVIGVVRGSDPALSDEYVLMTAHLDHVGVGEGTGDQIHNGAMDNATGVAAMLEVARVFAQAGKAPRRTIVFAALTAEEEGLVGSRYLARHPVISRARPVAVVNADMPVLLYDFTDVIAYGAENSTLGEVADQAAASMDVSLSTDPNLHEDFFTRSDHFSFVQRGVPALFLMTGYANGGEAKVKEFLADHYHRPSDDLSLQLNWKAGAKFAKLNYKILRRIADGATAPRWFADDMLGQRYAPNQPKAIRVLE